MSKKRRYSKGKEEIKDRGVPVTLSLTNSQEDYLEAIAELQKLKKVVRVKDLANTLGVKASSVSNALKNLAKSGLIAHQKYDYVELTPKGEEKANLIQRRHQILKKFLTEVLLVKDELANLDACKLEHTISEDTLMRVVDFIEFISENREEANKLLLHFFNYLKEKYNI